MAISGAGRRAKGAAFEREIADALRRIWPDARRNLSQTRSAKQEGGDVLGVSPYHVECKRGVATIQSAMRQACADSQSATAADGNVPVVVSRQDRGQTLVTMLLDDWLTLVRQSLSDDVVQRIAERAKDGR